MSGNVGDGAARSPTVPMLRATECLQSKVRKTERVNSLFNREITGNSSNFGASKRPPPQFPLSEPAA